jgi:site-specific DNA-methyltransferase (adenine-specific)
MKSDPNDLGRFPANIIFDEEAGKILDEQSGKLNKQGKCKTDNKSGWQNEYVGGDKVNAVERKLYLDTGGASRFFYCPKASKKDRNDGCDGLPQKANVFMSPDSRMDKEHYERTSPGMERFKTEPKSNYHPTVKPTDLMAYLVRLVTPKGGLVLDPFMGSGSTGKAAVREGMNFIGIEREGEYMEIAKSRIEYEQKGNKHQQFWTL